MYKILLSLSLLAVVGSAQAMIKNPTNNQKLDHFQVSYDDVHGDSNRINNEDIRLLRNLLNATRIFKQPDEETLKFINTIDNSAFLELVNGYYKIKLMELQRKDFDTIIIENMKKQRKALDDKILARTKLSK